MIQFKEKIETALAKKSALLTQKTDSLRIFDGRGDGTPNLYIDQYADSWVASSSAPYASSELIEYGNDTGRSIYWKRLDQHEKESPVHVAGPERSEPFSCKENGVNFEISFEAGYSQGIFLDQRVNRLKAMNAVNSGDLVLNTFAYTGVFSSAVARKGATTTTLDLSQPYLDWAKRNMELNHIDPNDHYFCKGDTFHWLKRFQKSGRSFNGIILDPPTFSRDAKGKVFRVEKDYHYLVELASALLKKGGWLLCCTNCRKIDDYEFQQQIRDGATKQFRLEPEPMPEEYTETSYLKSVWCYT